MKSLALMLAIFATSGPSHSHFIDPFDLYMAGVKSARPDSELSTFAQSCGVPVLGARAKYAVGGSEWQLVPNLAKTLHEMETDHFATAQVWQKAHRHFVVIWSYDLEQEYRTSYCFGTDDKLKFLDIRAWIFEMPSGKGWSFAQHWFPNTLGKPVADKGHFSSMDGKPITTPQIDEETRKEIDLQDNTRSLKELKLPAAMLR